MEPFNHTESRHTANCLVIKNQKVSAIGIGYKYSMINKNFCYG